MRNDGLWNAPPTISSLHGVEREKALIARDRQARANWLATRAPRGPLSRLKERLFG